MKITIEEDYVMVGDDIYRKVTPDTTKVGRSWIANYLGCSLSNVCQRPWLCPDYGEKLKTERQPYTITEVVEWNKIPLAKRRKAYKEYLNAKEAFKQD